MEVDVATLHATFLGCPSLAGTPPRLANALLIEQVPYRWQRGESETVPEAEP